MATALWTKMFSGSTAGYINNSGNKVYSEKTIGFSGDLVPSNATVTLATFDICFSVNDPASYTNYIYWLKANDGTSFISSTVTKDNQTVWNNHDYYNGKNGIQTTFTSNLSWFLGKSSGTLICKAGNKGKGTSYYRGVRLALDYYVRCSDPKNVIATGGLKTLSATWTLGVSGIDDTASHKVCYNTSQTWNSATAISTSSTSASWTINTAGTYYVGIQVTGSSSGAHNIVWSNAAQVTTFSPTLVIQGEFIRATDYNQIRNVYSNLTAMIADTSKIDDENITVIRDNYNSNVVAATFGNSVTADYFNNNVLGRIT